jgi:Spx/MgsR family transcriptional regulator
MTAILHGIKNCDSVKRARQWLQAHNVDYAFRDFRETAPTADEMASWLQRCDWQQMLNKRSTTWKSLSPGERDGVVDSQTAGQLLQAYPTLIKRPLLTLDDHVTCGFSDAHYASLFATSKEE